MAASLLGLLPAAQKQALKAQVRQWQSRGIQLLLSYSPADLDSRLRELGVSQDDSIMMHGSFSHVNGFQGEPRHVIDCLLDVIGPGGHLFMMSMAYTGSSREYLSSGELFDVRRTASQMGLLTETFRRRKGVLRSANPMHPVLAWGPRAEWIVAGHEDLVHSCGRGSPFEKMLELDTKALLFDVDLRVLTFMHYLEDRFQESAPVRVYTDEPLSAAFVDRQGQRKRMHAFPFGHEAMRQRNFAVAYDALARQRRVRYTRVGNTRLRLVSLRDVVGCVTELVRSGTHIFGRAGESVRVRPARQGLVSVISEEIASGRAVKDARRVVRGISDRALRLQRERGRPEPARHAIVRDRLGLPDQDAGIDGCVVAAVDWVCRAQDRSGSGDGGAARHYSLISGWSDSDPDTTGLIIPIFLARAEATGDDALRRRAERMLDWLVCSQAPDGSFRSCVAGAQPGFSVALQTGQVLSALAAGTKRFAAPRYGQSLHRAARWLLETQESGGYWPREPSPANEGRACDAHVARGLLEAARLAPGAGYESAALASVRWALTHQRDNGWFGRCCPVDSTQPTTHSLGYLLRGVLEAHQFSQDDAFLEAACRTADALMRVLRPDGFLAGRLRSDWSAGADWSCSTGSLQLALCWFYLYQVTGHEPYLQAGQAASRYVRRTLAIDGPDCTRGAVKATHPIDGEHGPFQYLGLAATFLIDACVTERAVVSPINRGPAGVSLNQTDFECDRS